jgi:glycosyltransferase involved in cell wall biosynthesis
MTTLSVLLPVYNAAPYLKETLDSILQQSVPADQIVIVNDGSTDRSLELLTSYEQREQRILLINQPNGGVSQARNTALARCEGEFIALMDSDDICLPERFEVQLNTLRDQPADICGSWMRNFGASTRLNKSYPVRSDHLKWNYFFFGRTIANPSCMFRRSSIGETRYVTGLAFAEDYAFFLETIIKFPEIRLTNIPKPLLRYRIHSEQATQRLSHQSYMYLKAIQERLLPHPQNFSLQELLPLHFKVWKSGRALSETELTAYLPLMSFWSEWLSLQAKAPAPATDQWLMLMRAHRGAGKTALSLISQYARPYLPGWRSNLEQLIARFH